MKKFKTIVSAVLFIVFTCSGLLPGQQVNEEEPCEGPTTTGYTNISYYQNGCWYTDNCKGTYCVATGAQIGELDCTNISESC